MPDPIRKRFGYGQLWPLRPACSQNQAGWYMPDLTSRIRFSSVFPKKTRIMLRKTDPDPIWMAWSGLGQINTSGLEASRCAGIMWPGFWRDATGPLPVSHFQTRSPSSTDVLDNTVQNQPGSDLFPADCVRFGPNGSGLEASRCSRIIRPASGQRFSADPARMRIRSGMFTGQVQKSNKVNYFVIAP